MAKSVFRRYPSDDAGFEALVRDTRGNTAWGVVEDFFQAPSGGVTGTLSAALGSATLQATATLPIAGTSAITLGAISLSATGQTSLSGSLTQSLGAATLVGAGQLAIAASLAQPFGALAVVSTGTLVISGTLSQGFGPATVAGTGSVSSAPITGDLHGTFSALTVAGNGQVLAGTAGSANLGLVEMWVEGFAGLAIDWRLEPALGSLALDGVAALDIVGSLDIEFSGIEHFAHNELVEEPESQLVILSPDPPQTFPRHKTKEFVFNEFVQGQLDGYIKRERLQAKQEIALLEHTIAQEKEGFRRAAEQKVAKAGAIQALEADYLRRREEDLARARDKMLGLRRDQNIRNLKKAKEEDEKKKRRRG
jgi:hypothetical protein